MHSLEIMTDACKVALESQAADEDWQHEFASVVDPLSIIELIEAARRQVELEAIEDQGDDNRVSDAELQALAQLVREMADHIKGTASSNPDQPGDELVLRAGQLLGLAGL